MKIYVESKEIETKEIIQIKSAGHKKHGFIIHLTGERKIEITEDESYNMTNGELSNINDRYRRLREKVEKEWEKDKTEFTVLNL